MSLFDHYSPGATSLPPLSPPNNSEVCGVVPNGIVVFITSFAYLEALLIAWAPVKRNALVDLLGKEFGRPVFIEVKETKNISLLCLHHQRS